MAKLLKRTRRPGSNGAGTSRSYVGAEALEPRVLLNSGMLRILRRRDWGHAPIDIQTFQEPAPTGVTPAQMRHFYGVDAIRLGTIVGDGSGQTIAIVDPYDDPNAASDLAHFDAMFGLPAPPSFTKTDQNGGNFLPPTDPAGPGQGSAEVEESLDIEWAHVIAPAANLILVEANSFSNADLFQAIGTAASLPGVVTVSMSFGGDQYPGELQQDAVFATPTGHNPVTFLASTGDSGAPGGYPAFSPYVVAVGGTTLFLGSGGSYGRESGWSGSGGGFSQFEAEPSYQQSVQNSGARTIPDVAMDADPNSGVPVYDSYDFGSATPWSQIGGTSLSCPMWAGLVTIADQFRAAAGVASLDGPTQTLPRLYSLPQSDFHDITSGFNGAYSAGPGYDLVTGRGSPVANLLVPDLAGVAPPATVVAHFVFYNDSAFDNNDPAANASDDAAIATDKQVLLPGGTATFANYSSYSQGINGIMIDVSNLSGTPTLSDFSFLVGNSPNPSQWTAAPAPSAAIERPGAGVNGSTRIEFTFPDASIRNEWLQVAVRADANTGLATPDVFYFGNLVGQAGEPPANGAFVVTPADIAAARDDPHGYLNPAPITEATDYNRDARVDATDQLIARYNQNTALVVLTTPPAGTAAVSPQVSQLFNAALAALQNGDANDPGHLHKRSRSRGSAGASPSRSGDLM